MYYKKELDYLIKVLNKMRLQAMLLTPGELPANQMDFGLRRFFGVEPTYKTAIENMLTWAKENIIYKATDQFMCNYVFLRLPEAPEAELLVVGPYMVFDIPKEQLMEMAERFGVPAWRLPQLENYYSAIPVIQDEAPFFTMITVFGEVLWGSGDAFEIIDVNQELSGSPVAFHKSGEDAEPDDVLMRMKMLETRYAYENELIELVSQGHSHRAELMIPNFSKAALEQRLADHVRNMKNYCIICNTLLRKAAENGGVHPIYLDNTSSEFARRIESITSFEHGQQLVVEMVKTYCRLVRKNSMSYYSPLVQKTVAYIEADISGDLSLRALAAAQNVNASYLSATFRKETGKTITDYVNGKRMDTAARLLRSTNLQIQTVAQHCGISDVNYFSKIFKKNQGVTPKQFREAHRTQPQKREKATPGQN